MILKNEISNRADDFKSLCDSHQVKYLYAFGSAVVGGFDEEKSDIDLLVEIDSADPLIRGEALMSLWDNFEDFFHRKVDLLTNSSIKNPYLQKSIDSTKILIYDGTGKEYLSDILYSIELVEQFTESVSDYQAFLIDLKTQSAVERQLGIIGDAVNKYDQLFPDSSIQNANKIVGYRNRLIQAYDSVDTSIIWTIIKIYLAPLKEEIIKKID